MSILLNVICMIAIVQVAGGAQPNVHRAAESDFINGTKTSWIGLKKYKQRYLNIEPFYKAPYGQLSQCTMSCLKFHQCLSFNYISSIPSCELLDKDWFQRGSKFVWHETSEHFTISNQCSRNETRCGNPKKKCVPVGMSYECKIKPDVHSDQPGFCKTKNSGKLFSYQNIQWPWPTHGLCDDSLDVEALYISISTGKLNYDRNWEEYKNGFGNLTGTSDFWIGLEKLHQLTNPPVELIISMGNFSIPRILTRVKYDKFSVGDEASGYQLHCTGFQRIEGGPLVTNHFEDHKLYTFSTKDKGPYKSEAEQNGYGWWYGNKMSAQFFSRRYGAFYTFDIAYLKIMK